MSQPFTCLYFFLLGSCLFLSCQQAANIADSNNSSIDDQAPYLLVLGTAQDAGYPQASCNKSCCALVLEGKRDREMVTSLALMDPVSREAWLLDASPDFTQQLAMIEAEGYELAGVFPTHAHIGHYTGLMYLGREAMGASEMPVYVHASMAKFLTNNGPWSQLVSLGNISLQELQPDSLLRLNERLSITAFLVPHRDEFSSTFGFDFSGPSARGIYLPDIDKWDRWERSIDSLVVGLDYALLDATFYDNNELPNRDMSEIPHPFVVESLDRFRELSDADKAKVYFTHFNHSNPLLQEEGPAVEAVKRAGHRIARTGMRLPL